MAERNFDGSRRAIRWHTMLEVTDWWCRRRATIYMYIFGCLYILVCGCDAASLARRYHVCMIYSPDLAVYMDTNKYEL